MPEDPHHPLPEADVVAQLPLRGLLLGDVRRGADDADDLAGAIAHRLDRLAVVAPLVLDREIELLRDALSLLEHAVLRRREDSGLVGRNPLVGRPGGLPLRCERVVEPRVAQRRVLLEDDRTRARERHAEARLARLEVCHEPRVLERIRRVQRELLPERRVVAAVPSARLVRIHERQDARDLAAHDERDHHDGTDADQREQPVSRLGPGDLAQEIVAHLGEELVAAREQLLPERVPLPPRHGIEDRVAKRFLRRIATGHEGLPDALVLDDVERAPIGQLWDRHAGDAGGDLAVVEDTDERRELRQDVETQTLLPATMGVADHHRDRAHPAIGPVDGVELRLGRARGGVDLERSARTRQGLEIGDRIADEMLERYAQLVRCHADDVAANARELAQPLHRPSVAVEESCVRSEEHGALLSFHRGASRGAASARASNGDPPRIATTR